MGFPDDVSDKPLTEDIIRSQRQFIFSFYEWLQFNGIQVLRNEDIGGGTSTVFAIPNGKEFYLYYIKMTCLNNSGVRRIYKSFIDVEANETIIMAVTVNANSEISDAISLSIPLIIEGGSKIILTIVVGDSVRISIFGYLIDKKLGIRR